MTLRLWHKSELPTNIDRVRRTLRLAQGWWSIVLRTKSWYLLRCVDHKAAELEKELLGRR